MTSTMSRLNTLKVEFYLVRVWLSLLHRMNRLLRLAEVQIPKGFTVKGERTGSNDEMLYRSIIYTLFYANFLSISLIVNQEKLRLGFNYIDTKLIIRAIIERCITQKFILTDPKRLADLFLYWGEIEKKRLYNSREKAEAVAPDASSLGLDIDMEGVLQKWSTEREFEYLEFVAKWEALVEPKQAATKAKSWSGLSVAEMAKVAGLDDLYKLTYRETSWYTHSSVSVPDFFLRVTESGMKYSSTASNLQKVECYMQAERLFQLSFSCAGEALEWDLSKKIESIMEGHYSSLTWLRELIHLRLF